MDAIPRPMFTGHQSVWNEYLLIYTVIFLVNLILKVTNIEGSELYCGEPPISRHLSHCWHKAIFYNSQSVWFCPSRISRSINIIQQPETFVIFLYISKSDFGIKRITRTKNANTSRNNIILWKVGRYRFSRNALWRRRLRISLWPIIARKRLICAMVRNIFKIALEQFWFPKNWFQIYPKKFVRNRKKNRKRKFFPNSFLKKGILEFWSEVPTVSILSRTLAKNYENRYFYYSIKFGGLKIFEKSLERSKFWVMVASFKISNPDSVRVSDLELMFFLKNDKSPSLVFSGHQTQNVWVIMLWLKTYESLSYYHTVWLESYDFQISKQNFKITSDPSSSSPNMIENNGSESQNVTRVGIFARPYSKAYCSIGKNKNKNTDTVE